MDFLHATSHSDLGVFALGLLIAGAVSGLAAGVLGVGGGIVIVPVLYHVMAALGIAPGVRMQVAIATSLAAMIPAGLAHAQNSKEEINWLGVLNFAVPLLAGVALGCAATASADGRLLSVLFAFVAIPIVVHLAIGERKPDTATTPHKRTALTVASLCAFASVLTGIAVDTIRLSVPRVQAIDGVRERPTAAVLTVIVAVAGAIALGIAGWNARDLPPDSLGYVNLLGFALIAPVLLATESAGAALAHMMDLRRLRLVFAGLIVIATARMLWDALA